MSDTFGSSSPAQPISISSLAQIWAKKYVSGLLIEPQNLNSEDLEIEDLLSYQGRVKTATKLHESLRFTSSQAWTKTEELLARELGKHRINPALIDPWQIAVDSRAVLEKTLQVYTQQSAGRTVSVTLKSAENTRFATEEQVESFSGLPTPGQLSVRIAKDVGQMRRKYTAEDPRILGFVSMQFHYSGQTLMDLLSPIEQQLVGSYFKVLDDNLYMPLQRCYEAAATHDYDSPQLIAVRSLLPVITEIAKSICQKVIGMYPDYASYSGALRTNMVTSMRDVEMFQVYICLCVLEGGMNSVQEELFPLCVMLYPPLKVQWSLIRAMLRLFGQEIGDRVGEENMQIFRPYIKALWEMFAQEVLPDPIN